VVFETLIINFFCYFLPFPVQGVFIATVLIKLIVEPIF
jgi:hypothetical protein